MKRVFCAAVLAAALCLCLAGPSLAAAEPDPLPPVDAPMEQMSSDALSQIDAELLRGAFGEASSDEPSGEASSDEPSAEAEESLLPLAPGKYESADGSELEVNEDGTCTYETKVSGTVNGRAMSGRLTFHGTVENGAFSFTKVTFFGLDLTEIAKDAGYTDASTWEAAAAELYAEAIEP